MRKLVSIIYSFEDVERVTDYAIKLARDLNMELEFLHAVESENISWDPTVTNFNSPSSLSEGADSLLVKERKRVLQKVLQVKKVSLDYDYTVRFKVVADSVSGLTQILSRRDDVDLVIIPYTDKNKIDIVISELIDDLELPVFTFPVEKDYKKIKTMVYASDFQKEDMKILKRVAQVARKFKASITVFQASKPKDFDTELKMNGLREFIDKKISLKDIQAEHKKGTGTSQGIRKFTQDTYADLVVILKQNKSFLEKFFGRSSAKEVLHDIDTPTLIYHQ